jgi:protein-disulfide isomerase
MVAIAIAGGILAKQIKRSASITTKTKSTPLLSSFAVNIPIDKNDPLLGNPGAPLTLVEFSDLNCVQCAKVHATLYNFVEKYPKDARLIWKDAPAPSVLWKNNNTIHEAALCAGKQNQFWKFVELAYGGKNDPAKIAETLGLNMNQWRECAASEATKQKISAATELARNLGINSAPVIFVNNKMVNLTEELDLTQMLNSFIAK